MLVKLNLAVFAYGVALMLKMLYLLWQIHVEDDELDLEELDDYHTRAFALGWRGQQLVTSNGTILVIYFVAKAIQKRVGS